MRTILLSCLLSYCLLITLLFPFSLQAQSIEKPPPLLQDIQISFDLASSLMQGKSTLILPPERALELSFIELENVRIEFTETGTTEQETSEQDTMPQELVPNSDNTLSLPPAAQERTLTLTWQVIAPPPGMSGNLITLEGITLAGFWHPTADKKMLFSLKAELPPGFSGVTEANEIEILTKGEHNILKANAPHPLHSINFAAGPYTVLSRDVNNLTLYSYFFAEDEALAPAYLDKAVEYIQRYEDLIGPFPYKRYSIVENRLPTGYGMPGFTLLGQTVVRLPFIKDTSLGHEILHSWFGNAIDNKGGNWCEGLTTLLADQSYAAEKGKGAAYRKNQILRYHAYVEPEKDLTVFNFQHANHSEPMPRQMRAMGYDKVSMIFYMLRQEIGEEYFFAGLRQLYQEKKYGEASWSDLENTFAATSGQDLSLFFSQWLARPDIPSFTVEHVGMEQKGGKSQISFRLVQQTEQPYQFHLPLLVTTRGESIHKTIIIDSANQEVLITVPSLPTELVIDPDYQLLRSLDNKERPPVWIQFMGAQAKRVVLPEDKKMLSVYLPLIPELERWGCQVIRAEDLKNSELSQGSFLFLGDSSPRRSLFGTGEKPETGFLLDVRKNPLHQDQVMVLLSSASTEESQKALRKLRHYGKYSRLVFKQGKIQKKEIAPADKGIRLPLLKPAVGIPAPQVQDFSAILNDISKSKIIYVGETHTDYGAHLLQLQVIQALREQLEQEGKNAGLVIGMEMFPRTSQPALDGYINGTIATEEDFLRLSDYYGAWGYDYRMYRDIINYAKAHDIPIIALNLNKEIARTVFKKGSTDELTPEQQTEMAQDRNLDLVGYQERLTQVHALHKEQDENNFGGFLQAQAIWDETMAESITDYLLAHPDKNMVVVAGTGHVYKDNAIPPRVSRRMAGRQSVLIANNGQVTGREKGWQADYLMFTEEVELPPAGKIGVILKQEEKSDEQPSRVKIIGISPLGKAEEAGLEKDDIILAVDNAPVATIADLKIALLDKKPGETIQLNIVRKETMQNIKVELSDMEKAAMMPPGHPKK
ncbi:ChaN family lipoprotein [Candidatus Electrothrix sp.]|uniref:ChaN family lipoprotein n=1 Tax=Candidatus Electrothrix sp. TaxID=2170559 RepID=UPI004056044D